MNGNTTIKRGLKNALRPLANALSYAGIDPRGFLLLRDLPKYLSHHRQFRALGGDITHTFPVLSDYRSQAGSANGHYFHQDLLVASFIHDNNPQTHLDIGSRIDGFVAHVAAFRPITVLDVRDLPSTGHDNITFIKANLMDEQHSHAAMSDSISCLHALEHFGLGRYGDPLDPQGHIKGFNNILDMLKVNGTLYISFPIGQSNEVHFNAHRVFAPRDIFNWPSDPPSIQLTRFDYVDDDGHLHRDFDLQHALPDVSFGCGIYSFRKIR